MIVTKGGSQSNAQQVPATTSSKNNINFTVTVPSEETLIDRDLSLTATAIILITIPPGLGNGVRVFQYGTTEALNQFPLNCLISSATCNINQCNVSVNTRDILHVLTKMVDDENFNGYNTPHMSDKRFKKYSDMGLSENGPLRTFDHATY